MGENLCWNYYWSTIGELSDMDGDESLCDICESRDKCDPNDRVDWHPIPDRVVKNGPALVVFWCDGTKTVVKRKKGEKDDLYHAYCAALAKKIYGSNSQIHRMIELIYDETDAKKNKKSKD